jgi:protein-S-isoprenylcysteine O-methyltransferase Ste14
MNIRLLVSRGLLAAAVFVTLFTEHAWPERGAVDTSLAAAGDVLLIAGCVGRIWCAVHIAGRKNADLVMEGPYSLTRNPLYLFTLIALVGAGLVFESLVVTALFVAVFFATHWPTILKEERFLAGHFGETYAAYMARVPRFLPSGRAFARAGDVTISAPVFTRAMMEAALIPLVYLGAQAIEAAHEAHLLPSLARLY